MSPSRARRIARRHGTAQGEKLPRIKSVARMVDGWGPLRLSAIGYESLERLLRDAGFTWAQVRGARSDWMRGVVLIHDGRITRSIGRADLRQFSYDGNRCAGAPSASRHRPLWIEVRS